MSSEKSSMKRKFPNKKVAIFFSVVFLSFPFSSSHLSIEKPPPICHQGREASRPYPARQWSIKRQSFVYFTVNVDYTLQEIRYQNGTLLTIKEVYKPCSIRFVWLGRFFEKNTSREENIFLCSLLQILLLSFLDWLPACDQTSFSGLFQNLVGHWENSANYLDFWPLNLSLWKLKLHSRSRHSFIDIEHHRIGIFYLRLYVVLEKHQKLFMFSLFFGPFRAFLGMGKFMTK